MSFESGGAFACVPVTERGRALVLGADPKGKNYLYCNGNSVFIRDVENPAIVDIYTQHSQPTTVAKYAPSGFYICSGDITGKIRIWDTTQKEHILKNEFRPFSGIVRDIVWSPDSKRLVIVGAGNQQFGVPILWDTGTTVGEISNHTKVINTVDFKPTRPFRVVTGGDDYAVVLHEGPPFKYKKMILDHSNFVQVCRYSPNGEIFVTGASDGKMLVYDGKTGESVGSFGGEKAHKGSVFGLTFSPDGTQILTCSGDKTAKLWDVETKQAISTFQMGTEVQDMQQGCLWMGSHMLTVSLSGFINYLDKNNPDTPLRVVKGHSNNITAMTISDDKSTIFTASHSGRACFWDANSGVCDEVGGSGHGSQVSYMDCCGSTLASIGFDDQLKFIDQETKAYKSQAASTESQPRAVASGKDGLVVVVTEDLVIVYRNGNEVFKQKEDYHCSSVSIHPNQTEVAVGGDDKKVHIYSLDGDTLNQVNQLTASREITAVAYSPDGSYIIGGECTGRTDGWKPAEDYAPLPFDWKFHQAKIQDIAWAPDGEHFATCALDSNILIWNINKAVSILTIKGAHQGANITSICWVSGNKLASSGFDKSVRLWNISFS